MLATKLLWIIIFIKSCAAKCNYVQRIVGGKTVSTNERNKLWPFLVSLNRWDTDEVPPKYVHFCGGSIISENQVLTAAHCFIEKPHKPHHDDPNEWIVFSGSRNNTLPNVSRHQHLAKKKLLKIPGIFGVKKIEIHENYVPGQFFNDIAIMTMTKPFEFDRKTKDKTKKGKLQTKAYITKTCEVCKVAGWGDKSSTGEGIYPEKLRRVDVPIRDTEKCRKSYQEYFVQRNKTGVNINYGMNICAGRSGKDSCQADSGGPLICKNSKKKWKITGLVSWGLKCGDGKRPGVYVSVSNYRNWINNHTNKEKKRTHLLKEAMKTKITFVNGEGPKRPKNPLVEK